MPTRFNSEDDCIERLYCCHHTPAAFPTIEWQASAHNIAISYHPAHLAILNSHETQSLQSTESREKRELYFDKSQVIALLRTTHGEATHQATAASKGAKKFQQRGSCTSNPIPKAHTHEGEILITAMKWYTHERIPPLVLLVLFSGPRKRPLDVLRSSFG